MEGLIFGILRYFNFCSLLVRYHVSLGKSLYGVYKNPQCNWECCFSVILSAQGGRANDGGVTDDDGDQDMETNQAQIDYVGVRIIYRFRIYNLNQTINLQLYFTNQLTLDHIHVTFEGKAK